MIISYCEIIKYNVHTLSKSQSEKCSFFRLEQTICANCSQDYLKGEKFDDLSCLVKSKVSQLTKV